MSDKQKVIAGILEQGRAEAERILTDAESTVRVRKDALETRLEQIRSNAQRRAEAEAERIAKKTDAAVAVEKRRASLSLAQDAYSRITDRVRDAFGSLVGAQDYRTILRGWIVEAAVGLGSKEAGIRVSEAETDIAADVMDQAATEASKILGFRCTLTLDRRSPTPQQGVVATSADGQTAYNNQIDTRIRRYEQEIRTIVSKDVLEAED